VKPRPASLDTIGTSGDTRYYAEPFEAPEWRAQWVERMEA
jgi:hypothetical protein